MNYMNNDTICALATGGGISAIALIRISGKETINIVNKIFSKDLSKKETHTVHFGNIIDNKNIIDEVVITLFHKNQSFTGEETVEISCHGSKYIQNKILELLINNGVRIANPGEYTMRAFQNGKLDLSQAESVADLIEAESEAAHKTAIQHLRGGFSKKLKLLRQKLIDFASLIELELDFSEEDVEFADRTQLNKLLEEL
ncbi:tRNA uridine-5-carboxymethylaminomethyl(34) synthesis GTPase MnmE, partial [bacterium]|nr:tRNA uridine-5-carboxymethylaminomethyl(34) synthesis GTPase MnmE [bacterium]